MKIQISGTTLDLEDLILDQGNIKFSTKDNQSQFKIADYTDEMIKLSDGKNIWKIYYNINLQSKRVDFFCNGKTYNVGLNNTTNTNYSDLESNKLEYLSPMPGKISKVSIKLGQNIKKGDVLLYLEAMKMEHPIKAAVNGTVEYIVDSIGQQVDQNTLLAKLKKL